jgi:2-polyprenyl-3-methyl-5-hydroxy-6-metoxy-1,4-benzoquinol methylase
MDDPAVDPIEHSQALKGLARLNQFSGVAGLTYRYVRRLTDERLASCTTPRPLKILDVASGSGDVPINWARRAKRDGIELEITTLDISPVALEQQQRLAKVHGVRVRSIQMNCLTSTLPTGFDLVTNSLFMHHLEVPDAVHLLRQMRDATDNAILVCDLERSRLNVALVAVAGQVLSRSKIVHHDGPQSVRGAFTRNEFAALGAYALETPMQVDNAFPCRFIAFHTK